MAVSIVKSWIKIMPDQIAPAIRIKSFGFMPDSKWVPFGAAQFFMSNSEPSLKTGIQFGAHAEFSLGPGDSLSGWKVAFFQIARESVSKTRYTGRTPSEGSIECNSKPTLSSKPFLDCNPGKGALKSTIPWYNTQPNELFKGSKTSGNEAAINTQDHPKTGVPLAMKNNRLSNVYNFLYDFRQDTEFWTILTAMEPAGALQYLGYCHWRVVYKVDFVWRSAAPQSSDVGSRFDQDKQFVPGAPTDADLQPILANPVGPIADDVFGEAHKAALDGMEGDFWSHWESEQGIWPIRLDFWGGDLPPNVA